MILAGGEPFYLPGGSVGCLLIHGFVSTPREMRWLGEQLNHAGFSVLGVRLFGHATKPSDLYRVRWEDWIASIQDGVHLLRSQCEKIVSVGLSLGGAMAFIAGSTVALSAVVAISTPYQLVTYPKAGFLRSLLPGVKMLSWVIRSLPKPPPLDFHDRTKAKEHLTYSIFPTRGVIEIDKLLGEMQRILPNLTIPCLVIHSRSDRGVPIYNAVRIIQNLKSAKAKGLFIEHSGHVILLEPEREKVAAAVIDFVGEVTGTTQ